MCAKANSGFQAVFKVLKTSGVLVESDPSILSLVTIIVGEPIHGSWWGHPKGNLIYEIENRLVRHRDVLLTKLISGKTTFIHRKLWPAILSIANSNEAWQLDGLSDEARFLLEVVKKKGEVRTDKISWKTTSTTGPKSKGNMMGNAARELESRILVYGRPVHTEYGMHAKLLESWDHWSNRVKFNYRENKMPLELAKKKLETTLSTIDAHHTGKGSLPWVQKRSR